MAEMSSEEMDLRIKAAKEATEPALKDLLYISIIAELLEELGNVLSNSVDDKTEILNHKIKEL